MLPSNHSLSGALQQKGINRRRFLKFCSLMTATLALPPRYVAQVAAALEKARKPVLVWLQFQDCAGNSESILRSSHPTVLEVVLDLFSWEYHELVMAGAGQQAEAALERVVREEKGKFIAVVEGAVPLADDGVYCTVGAALHSTSRATSARTPPPLLPPEHALGMEDSCGLTPIPPAPWVSQRRCQRQQ